MKGRLKKERRSVVIHLLWGVRLGGVSCRHESPEHNLDFWFDSYYCEALNVVFFANFICFTMHRQIVPIFLDFSFFSIELINVKVLYVS